MTLASTKATSTSTVLDSIGINTHIDFNNYGYQNLTVTEAAINYLGVKNLRDSAQNSSDVGPNGSWQQVANATGAKFDDYMGEGSPALDVADLSLVKQLASQGILNFVEGGNENDNAYALSQGNSLAWTASFQQQVYALGHSLGLPVINMSFGSGWTAANNWHGDYDKVGNLSAYADYGNVHTYPTPGELPDTAIQLLNAISPLAAPSRPVIQTEIGWDTNVTDPTTAAKYTLDAVFDGIKEGDVKSYFYSLFDDGSGDFGLMNQDGSAKPAGVALHNLTTILADSGASRTDSLTYGLSGTTSHDSTLLMEKSDGTFQLAIWDEVDAAHAVTLNLGTAAQTVRIYDPLTGTSAVQTYSNASSITLTVPDHPVIVEIVPNGTAASSPSQSDASTPNPVLTVPGAETTTLGATLAVSGLSVSDPWAASHAGSLALNVTATGGTVSGTDSAGHALNGSGTSAIHVSGTLAEINAELAGLTFTSAQAGTAAITVDVWDQAGVEATKSVVVTVDPATSSSTMPTVAGGTDQQFTINAGQSLHVTGGGTNTVYAFGDADKVMVDSGTNTIFGNGTGNTFTGGSGTDLIQAFAGGNTLKAGSGTETISFAGSNNTIFVGTGQNTINDSGSNNTIAFSGASGNPAQIYGYVLQNGDTFDFRALLAGTSWTGDSSTIGNFLKVGASAGDAVISIDPSGQAGGASSQVAVLHGSGPVSLSTLLAHSLV